MDKIIGRSIRFKTAPYLLKSADYCDYIVTERNYFLSWPLSYKPMILIGLYIFAFIVLILSGGIRFWIPALAVIVALIVGRFFLYIAASGSPKRWWYFLAISMVLILLVSICLTSLTLVAIAPIYFSLAHLVSLFKAKTCITRPV
jgi:hypothetical protein